MVLINKLICYFDFVDYYCYCICLVLVEKNVVVEVIDIEVGCCLLMLVEVNFYGSVLILVDCDLVLYELMVVMEYFDECYLYLLLLFDYLVKCVNSCLLIYCIQWDWCFLVDWILDVCSKEVEWVQVCKELCESLIGVFLLFVDKVYFFSEDFSLVDCCLLLIFWCLLLLGIELLWQVKLLFDYMECGFVWESFWVSLFFVE